MSKTDLSDVFSATLNRRSVRKFADRVIPEDIINEILESGRWAPSGINNQPWRFVVIQDKTIINQLAHLSPHSKFIKNAPLIIAVFMDNAISYDRTKDTLAIGACIQNMLLYIHSIRLGACWIGDILARRNKVEKLLEVPDSYELMALLAIGYPAGDLSKLKFSRKKLTDLVFRSL